VKVTLASLLWALSYLAVLAAVVGALVKARRDVVRVYGTPAAQVEWDTWRTDAKKMAEHPAPVKRREPKSAEPPALVLMRDHFASCLGLAVLLSSVLFGTFMFFIRGALAASKPFVDRSLNR
jgi:hypothetical protein